MKRIKIKSYLLLMVAGLFFLGCNKEDENLTVNNDSNLSFDSVHVYANSDVHRTTFLDVGPKSSH